MAPERDFSQKRDIWAIGILVHFLLAGEVPLLEQELKIDLTQFTEKQRDFLKDLLNTNP